MCEQRKMIHKFSGDFKAPKLIEEMAKTAEGSFFLCNLSDITRKFRDWIEKIPRVKPFYAVSAAR